MHTIVISEQDAKLILALLAEQPWKVSSQTMSRLQGQLEASQRKRSEAEREALLNSVRAEARRKKRKPEG